jgi:hypothetical protein
MVKLFNLCTKRRAEKIDIPRPGNPGLGIFPRCPDVNKNAAIRVFFFDQFETFVRIDFAAILRLCIVVSLRHG